MFALAYGLKQLDKHERFVRETQKSSPEREPLCAVVFSYFARVCVSDLLNEGIFGCNLPCLLLIKRDYHSINIVCVKGGDVDSGFHFLHFATRRGVLTPLRTALVRVIMPISTLKSALLIGLCVARRK